MSFIAAFLTWIRLCFVFGHDRTIFVAVLATVNETAMLGMNVTLRVKRLTILKTHSTSATVFFESRANFGQGGAVLVSLGVDLLPAHVRQIEQSAAMTSEKPVLKFLECVL
jgi:hypothetical protein